jgi:hypothetical protein
MPTGSIAPLLRRLAPQYGIDPAAAIAVALGEGGLVNRAKDIGDLAGGGSYGPFQLYAKGALPSRYRGNQTLADKSVRLALGRLGNIGGGGVAQSAEQGTFNPKVAGSNPAALTPGTDRRSFILQGLIRGDKPLSLLEALPGIREGRVSNPLPPGSQPGASTASASPSRGMLPRPIGSQTARGFSELIYDPVGSVFDGVASNKPYGGHGKHLHFASRNPQVVLRGIALAQQLGLNIRENPYIDPVDPVHTKGSHHYQTFPGKYNGRSLGQALDISGNPKNLKALYQRLAALR